MRTANVLTAIAAFCWLGFASLGRGGILGIVGQGAEGYPNAAQIDYYFTTPVVVSVVLLLTAWICNAARRWAGLLSGLSGLSLLALIPYLLPYSGGV